MFTVSKSGDLSGVAKELQRSAIAGQKAAGKAVAKDARTFILDDVRQTRGHLRMMRTKAGGRGQLNVKTRTTASMISSEVELYATPAGPWTIVTKGTQSYDIYLRRANGKKVLSAGEGHTFGTAVHRPRRAGRDYWGMAVSRLDGMLFDTVAEAVDDEMGV